MSVGLDAHVAVNGRVVDALGRRDGGKDCPSNSVVKLMVAMGGTASEGGRWCNRSSVMPWWRGRVRLGWVCSSGTMVVLAGKSLAMPCL